MTRSRLLLPCMLLLVAVGFATDVMWQWRVGIIVVLEVAFVVVAIREVRRTAAGGELIEVRIARSLGSLVPPRLARFAAFELVLVGSALRFLCGGWRRPVPAGFTYHRESNLRLLLPVLPLLAVGDILLLEFVVLPHAATWLRVLIHALAIYGLVWLVGLYATVRARPHQIDGDRLTLHRGILRRLEVSLAEIASIDPLPSFADGWKQRAYLRGAVRLDVAGPPILEIRLRDGHRVLAAVDDPAAFVACTIARER